jgi:hypothetical protein
MLNDQGGDPTGLFNSWDQERGFTIEESYWRDRFRQMLMVYKIQYRRWRRATMIRLPDNSMVEFDRNDPVHRMASNRFGLQSSILSEVRFAWYAGPHKLADFKSPEPHNFFTLVPFWGHTEDRTGAPYGRIRNMIFMQDMVNSSLSKMRWGMSSVNVKRTEGAYRGTNAQLRRQIARPDCDIVLDREHMSQPGAMFEIDRNYQTTREHFDLFMASKDLLRELSGVTPQFAGLEGAETNSQYKALLDQAATSMADINDNFDSARGQVGKLLMYMIVSDIGNQRTEINIEGGGLRDNRRVVLNERQVDPMTNKVRVVNQVRAQMLRVSLADVPNTSSYRQQQLLSFTEAFKSTTAEFQSLMMPHMISLMDLPNKADLLKEMQQMLKQPSVADKKYELDRMKLEAELRVMDKTAAQTDANAIRLGVESQFSAMQAGSVIAQNPDVAPIADAVMQNAGFSPKGGPDPNLPIPPVPTGPVGREAMVANGMPDVRQNTSPLQPPVPAGPVAGMETPNLNDNLR